MNEGQTTPQTATNVGGIPLPAGTDDNGNPFWLIDGRKVLWAEMQQYIWQMQQNQRPVAATGGKGPEGLGQMIMPSNVEAQLVAQPNPEVMPQVESRMESARERGIEKRESENRVVEAVPQQTTAATAPKPAASASAKKAPSLLGDSPDLDEVDPANPASMLTYVDKHHKDSPENSSAFLATLLEKILKVFSLEH